MNEMEYINNELWNELHREKRHQPIYPSESVIRFASGVEPELGKRPKVLDVGCGTGRHVLMMKKMGIEPYGVDYSKNGVYHTKHILKEIGAEECCENIKVSPSSKLPFESSFFDGCICYGVLYYMPVVDIEKSVAEMWRVLRKGGRIMLHVRSTDDYRFNKKTVGEMGDEHGLLVDERDATRSAYKENGMFMHFFTRKELENLMNKFNDVSICSELVYHDNDRYADANYVVTAEK